MKVKELIELLMEYGDDTEVLGFGRGGDLNVVWSEDDQTVYIEELEQ